MSSNLFRFQVRAFVFLGLSVFGPSLSTATGAEAAKLDLEMAGTRLAIEVAPTLSVNVIVGDQLRFLSFGPTPRFTDAALAEARSMAGADGSLPVHEFWYHRYLDRECSFPASIDFLCADTEAVRMRDVMIRVSADTKGFTPTLPNPDNVTEVIDGVSILVDRSIAWGESVDAKSGLVICQAPLRTSRNCVLWAQLTDGLKLRGAFDLAAEPFVPDGASREAATTALLLAADKLISEK